MLFRVPDDSAARSVGADAVAAALAAQPGASVRRNGSRGLYWLEPLVELEQDGQRIAFGNVTPDDAPALVAAGRSHARCLGPVDQIDWLSRQRRGLFARAGVIEPLDLDDYRAHGGLAALEKARATAPSRVIDWVERSGLRGRGGAGFPAARKWRTVAEQPAMPRYLVCNADEGDSGTFADRLLMEADPLSLVEGLLIAAHATGAAEGYIYIRSEYPLAIERMRAAVGVFSAAGLDAGVRLHVRRGAGAYICGEETALLDSLEGKRGMIRPKPPIPAIAGLFGQPTLVHNVLTLASVLQVIGDEGAGYASIGVAPSCGTQAFQLAGNIRRGGLVELPFGVTLRQLVEDFGGGTRSGRPLGGVQVGGPLGAYLGPDQLDVAMTYEALAGVGALLGHGGIVVFDDTVDWLTQAEFAFEFCAIESCGKCTPCRVGSVRGRELMQQVRGSGMNAKRRELLHDLCEVMRDASLCAMGGLTPGPVQSAIRLAHLDA